MSTRIAPSAALEAAIEEFLAEGVGDGERLPEIGRLGARLVLQRAVEEEVTTFLGRARYERTSEARGSRNGNRPRQVQTAEGELEIRVPQIRGAAARFVSSVIPNGRTERVEAAYWAAHEEATSPADGEARLRRLVTVLEHSYPSAAASLAEDLPALCVHRAYPLRLPRRLRSANLLERSLEEVKRRTKVIGRFPSETSCLSLCWAVLDLFIASTRGLGLTALEHRQLAQMRAATTAQTPGSLTA